MEISREFATRAASLARPKSASFRFPESSRRQFSGLTSRYTTPCSCLFRHKRSAKVDGGARCASDEAFARVRRCVLNTRDHTHLRARRNARPYCLESKERVSRVGNARPFDLRRAGPKTRAGVRSPRRAPRRKPRAYCSAKLSLARETCRREREYRALSLSTREKTGGLATRPL